VVARMMPWWNSRTVLEAPSGTRLTWIGRVGEVMAVQLDRVEGPSGGEVPQLDGHVHSGDENVADGQ